MDARPGAARRSRHRATRIVVTVASAAAIAGFALLVPPRLMGNGGTVQLSNERAGPFLVSVFSEPAPLRTGEIDISVLVQDADTRSSIDDAEVTVLAEPLDHAGRPGRYPATRAQATNKLFRAAKFPIGTAGRWRFTVHVDNPLGTGRVTFDAEVRQRTLLDRPVLLVAILLVPIGLLFWLAKRAEERREVRGGVEAQEE